MTASSAFTFPEQVTAVTPLDGDAIDGTPRPKLRRPRKPAREPMDRSHTFFCSNPQCDHATWAAVEQARHMAQEFWNVAQALVRLAPDSREALLLTGGVILKDLTDDECRAGYAAYSLEYTRSGKGRSDLPVHVRLRCLEYDRRRDAGTLTPADERTRRIPLKETCGKGHPFTEDNTYIDPRRGTRHCRACSRAYGKARYANPEKRARILEQTRARNQKLKEQDPEKYREKLERLVAWKKENKELRKMQAAAGLEEGAGS
jgi:hypothetical protein